MERRKLGQSDLEVSAIAFGAWAIGGWLWGGADENDSIAAIRKAIDLGITTIDTAAVYGFGRSEEIVAKAIAGRRDEVQILTKFGLRWDHPDEGSGHFETIDLEGRPTLIRRNGRPDRMLQECDDSLRRLKIDVIDLYQQHWPDPSTPIEDTFAALAKLLEAGKIRAVGVSNYSPEQMDEARKIVPLVSDQPPYSMLERSIEAELVPYCLRTNVGLIVYSPLQRGLLTGKFTPEHTFAEGDNRPEKPRFKPENRRRILELIGKFQPVLDAHKVTPAQLAINWTIHRPGVTVALVGARTPKQVEENARAADFRLSEDEEQFINQLLDELTLDL